MQYLTLCFVLVDYMNNNFDSYPVIQPGNLNMVLRPNYLWSKTNINWLIFGFAVYTFQIYSVTSQLQYIIGICGYITHVYLEEIFYYFFKGPGYITQDPKYLSNVG